MIPTEDGTQFFAVELQDVTFKRARILEPSGDPENRGHSSERVTNDVMERTFNDKLGWFSNFSTGGKRD